MVLDAIYCLTLHPLHISIAIGQNSPDFLSFCINTSNIGSVCVKSISNTSVICEATCYAFAQLLEYILLKLLLPGYL